jgi:hypothetical protein
MQRQSVGAVMAVAMGMSGGEGCGGVGDNW